MVRAAAPWLRRSPTTWTPGWWARTSSAVPSVEPLSTTTIGGCSPRAPSRARVPTSSGPRLRVAMTTATRAGDGGMGCTIAQADPPSGIEPERKLREFLVGGLRSAWSVQWDAPDRPAPQRLERDPVELVNDVYKL